jgi:hypothetical protein
MQKEWFNHIQHRGELAKDDGFLRGDLVSTCVTLTSSSGIDLVQYLEHFSYFGA